MAMIKPNRELISRVMLYSQGFTRKDSVLAKIHSQGFRTRKDSVLTRIPYSQGFRTAEALASKVVPLFDLCAEQLFLQVL